MTLSRIIIAISIIPLSILLSVSMGFGLGLAAAVIYIDTKSSDVELLSAAAIALVTGTIIQWVLYAWIF